MSHVIYIAFGSNLGDRISYINQALNLLILEGIISNHVSSSYYRSAPLDAGGGFYINTVVRAQTHLSPHDLLKSVLSIEEKCGRIRYAYHNPRTIDIDILLYKDAIIQSEELIIPHPRIQERAFVILPLLEINPDINIPGIGNLGKIIIPPNQSIEKLNTKNSSWKGKRAIMGILNITPDSFFDGGKYMDTDIAIKQVEKLLSEGADIIDIGGQSTRPGHVKISPDKELRRIEPIILRIRERFPNLPLSIDSFYPEVIKKLSKYYIDIINNVSGGLIDIDMIDAVLQSGGSYVLTSHNSNIEDMLEYFISNIKILSKNGISDIIIDPGFGFGKDIDQNYQILSKMVSLRKLNIPILAGISRKSMIYKILNIKPDEALNGSTAIHMLALMNGAQILRVHDVKEARETLNLFEIYERNISGI